ncbi:MAG: hypothetical protein MPJ24_02760 [Pirellulaceae bacterium]|nr:hypothetical protein [Pirellulaceae bacterium]
MIWPTTNHPKSKSLLQQPVGSLVLKVIGSEHHGREIHIRPAKCLLGKADSCNLRLVDRQIAPLHAVLLRSQAQTVIKAFSCESWLNGSPFSEAVLQEGDILTLGSINLAVTHLLLQPYQRELWEEAPHAHSETAAPKGISRTPRNEPTSKMEGHEEILFYQEEIKELQSKGKLQEEQVWELQETNQYLKKQWRDEALYYQLQTQKLEDARQAAELETEKLAEKIRESNENMKALTQENKIERDNHQAQLDRLHDELLAKVASHECEIRKVQDQLQLLHEETASHHESPADTKDTPELEAKIKAAEDHFDKLSQEREKAWLAKESLWQEKESGWHQKEVNFKEQNDHLSLQLQFAEETIDDLNKEVEAFYKDTVTVDNLQEQLDTLSHENQILTRQNKELKEQQSSWQQKEQPLLRESEESREAPLAGSPQPSQPSEAVVEEEGPAFSSEPSHQEESPPKEGELFQEEPTNTLAEQETTDQEKGKELDSLLNSLYQKVESNDRRENTTTLPDEPNEDNSSAPELCSETKIDGSAFLVEDFSSAEPFSELENLSSEEIESPEVIDGVKTEEPKDASIEDYMSQLLARVRSGNEEADQQESAHSKQTSAIRAAEKDMRSALKDESPEPAKPKKFKEGEFKPQSSAPEETSNLAAMRDLANSSSRTAIDVHNRRSWQNRSFQKYLVAIVGLISTVALLYWHSQFGLLSLIAAATAAAITLYWGLSARNLAKKSSLQNDLNENLPSNLQDEFGKEEETEEDQPVLYLASDESVEETKSSDPMNGSNSEEN